MSLIAIASGAIGREFESRRVHHFLPSNQPQADPFCKILQKPAKTRFLCLKSWQNRGIVLDDSEADARRTRDDVRHCLRQDRRAADASDKGGTPLRVRGQRVSEAKPGRRSPNVSVPAIGDRDQSHRNSVTKDPPDAVCSKIS